jgi:hypothetical protein
VPEIKDILKDRGSRYGDYRVQAETAQRIRDAFEDSPNWEILPGYMKEALSLMTTKFSRMLTGDMMYMDNVVDLIGYMTLMQTEMEKDHADYEKHMEKVRSSKEAYRGPPRGVAWEQLYQDSPDASDATRNTSPLNWAGPFSDRYPG